MSLTMLLPWFPIVLAVGVAGRLLGRARGFGFGLLCAVFWVVLVLAIRGMSLWSSPWTVAAVVAGSLAMIAMGGWSGDIMLTPAPRRHVVGSAVPQASEAVAQTLATAMDCFDDWLATHRTDGDPWPAFVG